MEDKKVVLIVDDSPSIRREVKVILEKSDYYIRASGSEFGMMNSIIEYGKMVDLILMDLTLNEEFGLDLIENLKAFPKYANIPVIVLTEHADRDNVEKAKILGVKGYLRKPINAELLLNKVNEVLKNSL